MKTTSQHTDLFIVAGEPSGDLHGEKLIHELLKLRPNLKIAAVAGPKMRNHPISTPFFMEDLLVMGFIDVLLALPKLIKIFFKIRNEILRLSPKAVILIDYPGFNLALEKSLRRKGYLGKLIHFISPTVWAWKKNRIFTLEKNLDLLLTIFPFEKKFFEKSSLRVEYVGHPLTQLVNDFTPQKKFQGKILAIFPGSRKKVIERNLPLQLKIAKELQKIDPELKIIVSSTKIPFTFPQDILIAKPEDNYELMHASHMAIATSGTVTLELALHHVPTIVTYAIKKLDLFLAQKIFKINLPFYCIVNIILDRLVFPEIFGPNLTKENLLESAKTLWFDQEKRDRCKKNCIEVKNVLKVDNGAHKAAELISQLVL